MDEKQYPTSRYDNKCGFEGNNTIVIRIRAIGKERTGAIKLSSYSDLPNLLSGKHWGRHTTILRGAASVCTNEAFGVVILELKLL